MVTAIRLAGPLPDDTGDGHVAPAAAYGAGVAAGRESDDDVVRLRGQPREQPASGRLPGGSGLGRRRRRAGGSLPCVPAPGPYWR
jgi:hypothetical protein